MQHPSLTHGSQITTMQKLVAILIARNPVFLNGCLYTASWISGIPQEKLIIMLNAGQFAEAIPKFCEECE
ncbi:MAG: hypothetical protein HQL77_14135 [Magnetococcales bacterium]|nr:hypothetical protein [Magnetococcales bacterium]